MLLSPACESKSPASCAVCRRAKLTNQWCDHCKVGYVAGVPISSRLLFDALDAHGHELDLSTIKCPTCRAAIAGEGFCEKCRIGWYHRQAYFSRLTFHLAQGTALDPDAIACPTCRQNRQSYGWCDHCNVGMLGNFALSRRGDWEDGCRGYDVMMAALAALPRCESCSLAIYGDMSCFFCKIAYREGKPIRTAASRPG